MQENTNNFNEVGKKLQEVKNERKAYELQVDVEKNRIFREIFEEETKEEILKAVNPKVKKISFWKKLGFVLFGRK